MKKLFVSVLLLSLFFSINGQKYTSKIDMAEESPNVNPTSPALDGFAESFDKFGHPTDLFYGDGRTVIKCVSSKPCSEKSMVSLLLDENEIKNKPCVVSDGRSYAEFEFNNTDMKFGQYACQYEGETKIALNFRYCFCSDDAPECAADDSCTDTKKFCVIHDGKGPQGSGKLNPTTEKCSLIPQGDSYCNSHSKVTRFCPLENENMCSVIQADNMTLAQFEFFKEKGHTTNKKCPQHKDHPQHLIYKQQSRFFHEPIHVTKDDMHIYYNCYQFKLQGPAELGFALFCNITNEYGATILNTGYIECSGNRIAQIKLNNLFKYGSRLYKLNCTAINVEIRENPILAGRTMSYLVVTEGKLKITKVYDATTKALESLNCDLVPPASSSFNVSLWWTRKEDNTIIATGPVLPVTSGLGGVVCNAMIVYKTCAPYRKFQKDLKIDFELK